MSPAVLIICVKSGHGITNTVAAITITIAVATDTIATWSNDADLSAAFYLRFATVPSKNMESLPAIANSLKRLNFLPNQSADASNVHRNS